jgi:hypothetical protein
MVSGAIHGRHEQNDPVNQCAVGGMPIDAL